MEHKENEVTADLIPLSLFAKRRGFPLSSVRSWQRRGELPAVATTGGTWAVDWQMVSSWQPPDSRAKKGMISFDELAKREGVSGSTIRMRHKALPLPGAEKIGRRWYVPAPEYNEEEEE
jgi:hypothetical protein